MRRFARSAGERWVVRPVCEGRAQIPEHRPYFFLTAGAIPLLVVDLVRDVAEQLLQAEALGLDLLDAHTDAPLRHMSTRIPCMPMRPTRYSQVQTAPVAHSSQVPSDHRRGGSSEAFAFLARLVL